MSRRSQTVINRDHPHNMRKAVGQNAKVLARNLSNKELDNVISISIEDEEKRKQVLAYTRSDKIKLLMHCKMAEFTEILNRAAEAQVEDKSNEA